MERNVRGLAPVLGLLMIVGAWGTALAAPAPDPTGELPPEALVAAQAALDSAAKALTDAQAALEDTQPQAGQAAGQAVDDAQRSGPHHPVP